MVLRLVILMVLLTLTVNADPNRYFSELAGFEITKPDDWQFSTAEEHLDKLKTMKLEDAEFQKRMIERSRKPLVVLMKHPEPHDDLNPTIKVTFRPLGTLQGKTATELLAGVLPYMKTAFKNFRIVTAPKSTTVSGLPAAHAVIEYDLESTDGFSFATTSELWLVPRGEYLFILGSGTRTDEKSGSRAEIQKILETVKIEPAREES